MNSNSANYLFTSESVSEGHPDKVADQISDGVLDAHLKLDPKARVACETLVKTGLVMIAGEITSKSHVDYSEVARKVIKDIGYNDPDLGFDYRSCGVLCQVEQQSPDIAQGVDAGSDRKEELGAGDQGMMFGFASKETPEFMPATIAFSHRVVKKLAEIRKSQKVNFLRPDAKSQVTVEYQNGKLKRVHTIVVSTQHHPDVDTKTLRDFVVDEVIKTSIPKELLQDTKFLINPTGRFVVGGPHGDCGLTGRKIIVDTYGGHGAHGGGAFSGKDPTKVDRSAAYMARFIAKNLVAAGAMEKCLVQLAYAIGVAEPVSVYVDSYGTSQKSPEQLETLVREIFPLRPQGIIDCLELRQPIYQQTAAYGHFGRNEFPWEKLTLVNKIKEKI